MALDDDDKLYMEIRKLVGHSWEDGKPQPYTKFRDALWTVLGEYEYGRLSDIQKTSEPIGTLEQQLKKEN